MYLCVIIKEIYIYMGVDYRIKYGVHGHPRRSQNICSWLLGTRHFITSLSATTQIRDGSSPSSRLDQTVFGERSPYISFNHLILFSFHTHKKQVGASLSNLHLKLKVNGNN